MVHVHGVLALVAKDLMTRRQYLVFGTLFLLAYAMVFGGDRPGVIPPVLAALSIMVPAQVSYAEERNRGLVLQRALAIPDGVIVTAKFALVVVVTVWFGAVAWGSFALRSMASGRMAAGLDEMGWLVAAVCMASTLFSGISVWAFFRWGYQATRYALFGVWVGFMGLVYPLTALSRALLDPHAPAALRALSEAIRGAVESIGEWANASPVAALGVAAAIVLLIYGSPTVAALRAFVRREP